MEKEQKIKITVDVTVNASVKKTWDAWTLPQYITKWNFASDDWCCPSAENDLRVGGSFKSRMEAKDKSFGFDFGGTYYEIVNLHKIAYAMTDGRQVVTIFESVGSQTKVTTTFDAENQNPVELQRGGWQAIANNFKKLVESI